MVPGDYSWREVCWRWETTRPPPRSLSTRWGTLLAHCYCGQACFRYQGPNWLGNSALWAIPIWRLFTNNCEVPNSILECLCGHSPTRRDSSATLTEASMQRALMNSG